MREKHFQGWILETATRFGWRVWHVPTPMRPIGGNKFVPDPRGRGLADLILLHDDPPRMILAEVKNETNETSPDQDEFLRLARGVAAVAREHWIDLPVSTSLGTAPPLGVYLWRPAHADMIEGILRGAAS